MAHIAHKVITIACSNLTVSSEMIRIINFYTGNNAKRGSKFQQFSLFEHFINNFELVHKLWYLCKMMKWNWKRFWNSVWISIRYTECLLRGTLKKKVPFSNILPVVFTRKMRLLLIKRRHFYFQTDSDIWAQFVQCKKKRTKEFWRKFYCRKLCCNNKELHWVFKKPGEFVPS